MAVAHKRASFKTKHTFIIQCLNEFCSDNLLHPKPLHLGDVWERLSGLAKVMLRECFCHASINYIELNTLICDSEFNLNNRRLPYLVDDKKRRTHFSRLFD